MGTLLESSKRNRPIAGIDNMSTVLVTGRMLVEGIGGVLMLAIHANALPFLCSKELKVLDFQIRKNGDKLLVKGGSLHYLLEVGVVHHCNLGLANLTEFVGGCSGHSIEDTNDDVQGKLVVANSIDDSLDSKTGLCDIFTRKVGKAEILEPLEIATRFFNLGYHSIDHATKERDSTTTLLRKFIKIRHDFVLEGLLHQFTEELLHPLIALNVNIGAEKVKEFLPTEAVLIL
jgi:hypothetical protein